MLDKTPLFESASFCLGDKVFTLKYFTSIDLDAIIAIELSAHPYPWKLHDFQSSLESHHCIGLQIDGQWVAYAVMSFVVGEAELLLFVVDRPWQGKKIASTFLRELVQVSASCAQTLFLEVRASNQQALNLYEAVGFNEVGQRANYYPASSGKREHALLLAMDISL